MDKLMDSGLQVDCTLPAHWYLDVLAFALQRRQLRKQKKVYQAICYGGGYYVSKTNFHVCNSTFKDNILYNNITQWLSLILPNMSVLITALCFKLRCYTRLWLGIMRDKHAGWIANLFCVGGHLFVALK